MSVRSSLFVNVGGSRRAAQLLACAGACALLSACVGNPFEDAKVDPRSPVAAEVAKSVKSNAPYPTFAGVPSAPKDVRPHPQFGKAATQIEQAKAEVDQSTADSAWTLTDPEALANEGRSTLGPDLPAAQPADAEAFAKDLRKRATPPPPVKR